MHVQLGVILMDAGAYVLEKASKRNIRGRERKRFLMLVNCLAGRSKLSDWLDGGIFYTYQEQGQQTRGLIGIFYSISIPKKYSYMYITPVLYLCRRPGGPIYIYGVRPIVFLRINRHIHNIHYFFIYVFFQHSSS